MNEDKHLDLNEMEQVTGGTELDPFFKNEPFGHYGAPNTADKKCPHCGSQNVAGNGGRDSAENDKYIKEGYTCQNCGKEFWYCYVNK